MPPRQNISSFPQQGLSAGLHRLNNLWYVSSPVERRSYLVVGLEPSWHLCVLWEANLGCHPAPVCAGVVDAQVLNVRDKALCRQSKQTVSAVICSLSAELCIISAETQACLRPHRFPQSLCSGAHGKLLVLRPAFCCSADLTTNECLHVFPSNRRQP